MTEQEVSQLTREALIELVLKQFAQSEALQASVQQLQHENEVLRKKLEQVQKPPTNSKNSSQPPSLDRKGNRPGDKARKRHGPAKGHEKHERLFVEHPDHIVELRAQRCEHCQAALENQAGELLAVNQITELPPSAGEVIEVRQYAVTCAECQQTVIEAPPAGLEMTRRFGARLETTVVYYRQEQHLSYQRTQQALANLHQVTISQGGIDDIMQRVGHQALPKTEPIQTSVQQSAVVNSDETGCRVNGQNWWEWVFCTSQAVLHVIRFNRSVDVIHAVMDKAVVEVWGSDCWPGQLKAPAKKRQLCLSHQLRNLQAALEVCPATTWPRAMQVLFRSAIHLHHQRDQLSPDHFAAQVARIERHCDRLLQRDLQPYPQAAKLQRRYQQYRQGLFVFLDRTDVEPTNNVAERALRHSVIHRKVMGSFRSHWGSQAFAALASVIDTAQLSGVSAFDAILALFDPPALPIPKLGE
jgi:transposase